MDPTATQLVRALYEAFQARDWSRAAEVVHPDALLEMPATQERLEGRAALITFMERYPEPWGALSVLRVVGDDSGPTAVAEIEIIAPTDVFRCAAFWTAEAGSLRHGVEYWVTIGGEQPPPRR